MQPGDVRDTFADIGPIRYDLGGRYQLELHRTSVDLIEKRVRLIGTLISPDPVTIDGVAPA